MTDSTVPAQQIRIIRNKLTRSSSFNFFITRDHMKGRRKQTSEDMREKSIVGIKQIAINKKIESP